MDRSAEDHPTGTFAALRHRVGSRTAIALVLAVLAAALLVRYVQRSDAKSPDRPEIARSVKKTVDAAIAQAAKDAAAAPAASATAYQRILPSMVFIRTDDPDDAGAAPDTAPSDTAPSDTAPSDTAPSDTAPPGVPGTDPPPSARRSNGGLGAGVIISDTGAILTANHVIDGATTIRVTFSDGTTAIASVVSAEPENDIAVLQAEGLPEVIVPAVMGGVPSVGEAVFAVGHPLGLTASLSAGVVSGLNRAIPIDEERSLDNLIQFDAAVNPGNSGGPLLNRSGQVVGIVTALANPAEQNFFVGIGFAVPIATAGGAAGGPPQ